MKSTIKTELPIIATKVFTNSDGEEFYVEQTFMSFNEANEWVCSGLGDVDEHGRQQTDFVINQTFIIEITNK
jgi:hypothetical protein